MRITLQTQQREKKLGDLFGLFFEDLNHAADGGLYAELIRNRDFEFDPVDNPEYTSLTGWATIGRIQVEVCTGGAPFPNNPHYARMWAWKNSGICNLGFGEGIPAKAGETYRLVVWARADKPFRLQAKLCGAQAELTLTDAWQRHELYLTPAQSDPGARLTLIAPQEGGFSLAYVSLMNVDTWMGRENGLRKDIAQALAQMKPRFLRFPGGCLTHDGNLDVDARDGVYNWKKTLGPVENRPARRNNWGYHQSMGLGFYEYFLLCEDMNCEPLPVVNGGLNPHNGTFAEGELLQRYIQDAVDLIDFAKGDTDTHWGRVRAEMGHPAPFRLRYLAVGNEENHPRFHENMALFAKALREKDPTVELIGSAGPVSHGTPYDMGWQAAREQKLDYVDEHYYQAPEWFLTNVGRYDGMNTDGPKVFVGEYASCGNKMENALAEAAYMTYLQTAPGVALACYAPMLCHINYSNWQPNMLWYDNSRIMKTPSYHVQSMFMRHQGDWSIPLTATENQPGPIQSRPMAGKLFLKADGTTDEIRDIRLTTQEGSIDLPDTVITDYNEYPIADFAKDFRLELTMRRTAGRKGIYIRFGEADSDNYYMWIVGGWMNADSGIEKRIRGTYVCLTQSNLTLQDHRDYRLVLQVQDGQITTWVDGEMINCVTEKPLRLQPLYLAASVEDTTGDVILKAVNVQKNPVTAQIDLPCGGYTAETLCAPPEAESDLNDPEKINTYIETYPGAREITHTFPGYSVTVLRVHACEDGR